ncbi:MAG TPA: hypothetical protein VHM91_10675 [Verrucomicrobiales bacterium]|nr:hypothetical protein [Verrucomicrobiales bacterium]
MKAGRLMFWLVPAGALFLGFLPGLMNRQWWERCRHYNSPRNVRLALARGYAREFESKNGRKPDTEELSRYAGEHFAGDFEQHKVDEYLTSRWKEPPIER